MDELGTTHFKPGFQPQHTRTPLAKLGVSLAYRQLTGTAFNFRRIIFGLFKGFLCTLKKKKKKEKENLL